MAQRTLPNLALQGFFDLGEDGWDDDMSLNLLKLSVLVQGTVLDKVSADPVGPADGDVYILDETHPTQANKVAIRDDGAWVYVTPHEGWLVYNQAAAYYEKFDGTVWAELETGGGGGGGGGGLPEAPEDDILYGRMNAAWEPVPGGGLAGEPVPFVGARVIRTANFTVGSAAAVAWTSETYDYGGWHDNVTNNSRLTVPDGVTKVRITGQVEVQSPSGGQSFRVTKNGGSTQLAVLQVGNSAYSFTVGHFDTGVIEVVPGDYFQMIAEGNSTFIPGRSFFAIEAVAEKVVGEDLSADVNTRSGTTYTLAETDINDIVEMSNAGANTLTIPANATVSLPVGAMFSIVQIGAGATTIQAAAGVSLNGVSEGEATLSGQWSGVSLYKRAADAWVIQGDHGGVS